MCIRACLRVVMAVAVAVCACVWMHVYDHVIKFAVHTYVMEASTAAGSGPGITQIVDGTSHFVLCMLRIYVKIKQQHKRTKTTLH